MEVLCNLICSNNLIIPQKEVLLLPELTTLDIYNTVVSFFGGGASPPIYLWSAPTSPKCLSEAKNEQDSQYQHMCEHKSYFTAGESVISRGRRRERAVGL